MDTFGVGIIGYGFIGKVHAYAHEVMKWYYDPVPLDTKLVAVCTSRPETAEAAKRHGGFEFGTSDPSELLARDDVQIVHICTPNDSHAELVLAALEAGKAVYCDKPLCITEAEARAVVDAAANAKLAHQMTFHNRFIPATLRAKQLVDSGALGRIFQFRCEYLHSGYVDPNRPMSWRLDAQKSGGGALFDLGAHAVDLARHLCGEIRSVHAVLPTLIERRPVSAGSSDTLPVEVDDLAILTVRTDDAYGIIEATRLATGTNDALRFEIHGEKGALRFDSEDPSWLHHYDGARAGGDLGGDGGFTKIECVQRYPSPAGWPAPKCAPGWLRFHVECLRSFLCALAEKRLAEPSLLDGARTQLVLTSAQESASSGREIAVPEIGATR